MEHKAYVYYTNGEVTAWKDLNEFLDWYRNCEGEFSAPLDLLVVTEFNSKGGASHYNQDELLDIANDSNPSDYEEHNTKWGL